MKVAEGDQRSSNVDPESEPGADWKERGTLAHVIEAEERDVWDSCFPTNDYSIALQRIGVSSQKPWLHFQLGHCTNSIWSLNRIEELQNNRCYRIPANLPKHWIIIKCLILELMKTYNFSKRSIDGILFCDQFVTSF